MSDESDPHIYTVYSDYFATGEGTSYMVLITRGYGPNKDPKENAMKRFRELFGSYMALGANVKTGLYFDFPGNKVLLSEEMRVKLTDWHTDAGGLEWHSSLHLNFS
jgi:predicted SAM-dependent methyltransferase